MTKDSHSSSPRSQPKAKHLRRQPKQQRGKDRVAKILDAAAAVFDQVGYEAATTHMIATQAGTAIGSLYLFFPNKAAIFNAMELRHVERVKQLWVTMASAPEIHGPLRQMIHFLTLAVAELFEQPVSRVIFIQFYIGRDVFQSIDESMTQEAIEFVASLLKQRNPRLASSQANLLAEVCVHGSNAVILAGLRNPDLDHRQRLTQQIEDLIVAYLQPYLGDAEVADVMKVMKCPHCYSQQLSKNGYRRGKQCYRCKDCGKQFVSISRLQTHFRAGK
jgi:AcrR family transcriptional regulator